MNFQTVYHDLWPLALLFGLIVLVLAITSFFLSKRKSEEYIITDANLNRIKITLDIKLTDVERAHVIRTAIQLFEKGETQSLPKGVIKIEKLQG